MNKYLSTIKKFLTQNTSSKQTVIKNTFWLLLAEGISKGSLAVLIIMIGRIFGKEVFGQYSYLSVILTFLVVFADLGITQLAIRDYQHIDEKHRRQYLVTGLRTKGLLSIAVTAVYIGILWFTADTSFLRLIGLILLTNNLTNSFLEYIRSTFRSLQKGETELRIKLIQGVGNLLLIPLLYVYQSLPLNLLGQSIVTIVTIGYARYLVRQRQLQTHEPEVMVTKHQLISNGWMFSMSMLFVVLYYYIDSVIIQHYWGYEATGVYNAAYRLLTIFIMPMGIMVGALFPTLRSLFLDNQKKFFADVLFYSKVVFGACLIIMPLLIVFAKQIIRYSFGQEYIQAVPIIQALFVSLWILYLNAVFGIALQSSGHEKIYMRSALAALVVNAIGNIIFVPIYGPIAAARVTICTELTVSSIQSGYFYFIVYRRTNAN